MRTRRDGQRRRSSAVLAGIYLYFGATVMDQLKSKMAQGGVAKLVGQAITFSLRLGYIVVLARLIEPSDFGLFTMVAVVTGVLEIFAYSSFTMATVQKEHITAAEISTLFWINLIVAAVLATVCLLASPALVWLYGEPRVWLIAAVLGGGFIVGAIGAQPLALMQRDLRYFELTVIDIVTAGVSALVGIAIAVAGYGYLALVGGAAAMSITNTACLLWTTGWRPGPPDWTLNVRSLLSFSTTVTLNNLVVHVAYNMEKLLLGRAWGAESLGLYGRAYQLIALPTGQLHGAIGSVAFAGLARLLADPPRYRRYFIKIYTLVVTLTTPITLYCAVFADDIIQVALGPKWSAAAPLFLALTPTVLIFGWINPLAWLLQSNGRAGRSLALAAAIAPICMVAYLIGLPYGPLGVARCYSAALALWLLPHVFWSLHGTNISPRDLVDAAWRPLVAAVSAAVVAAALKVLTVGSVSAFIASVAGLAIMSAIYMWVLLILLGQKDFYFDAVLQLRPAARAT